MAVPAVIVKNELTFGYLPQSLCSFTKAIKVFFLKKKRLQTTMTTAIHSQGTDFASFDGINSLSKVNFYSKKKSSYSRYSRNGCKIRLVLR